MKLENIFSDRNKILLRELIITDFKLRYQGSVLGYAWSVLKPLFLFAILYLVFDKFLGLGAGIDHFPVYLLLGIVLWTFFTEATVQGLQSIVSRGDLIRKISFPKYIIVISSTVSALINLVINLGVVLVFCFLNGVELRLEALLIVPLVIELYVFSLAIAFLLSAINAKYRDVGYLWDIFLQGAFYATPIIYPLQLVLDKAPSAAQWLLLNPIAQILQDARHALITAENTITISTFWSGWVLCVPITIISIIAIIGAFYFRRSQKYFAEDI